LFANKSIRAGPNISICFEGRAVVPIELAQFNLADLLTEWTNESEQRMASGDRGPMRRWKLNS
jgi:hypothetical protein